MPVLGLPLALIGIVLAIALALAPVPGGETGIPKAEADGGDFMLDFIAAAPDDYDHTTSPAQELSSGGLQFDARAINDNVVEQLEAVDFDCGDTIVFFTEITVDGGATGSQTASLTYEFDAVNNGQQGVGYSDVVAVGLSAEDPPFAVQTNESGHSKNGNESATLASGPTFFPGGGSIWIPGTHDTMLFTVDIDGLQAGETVIVRIDVRFSCYALPVTGNLHAAIDSAEVTAGGSGAINVGRQDIPMLGLGELPTPTPTPA
ncbi:MAG: hypothetical protein IH866_04275, partial [Chloroflexi bacterium]|nr:hypothetical protein [Chloroflexota bacterium]